MRTPVWLSVAVLTVMTAAVCGIAFGAPADDGTTPLHYAAHDNDVAAVDKLIKAGANVNARNKFGSTPMSEAAANGNTVIMEKLLNAGADPNSPSADGMTVLMII